MDLRSISPGFGSASYRSRRPGKTIPAKLVLADVAPSIEAGALTGRISQAEERMSDERQKLNEQIASDLAELDAQYAGIDQAPLLRDLVPAEPGVPREKQVTDVETDTGPSTTDGSPAHGDVAQGDTLAGQIGNVDAALSIGTMLAGMVLGTVTGTVGLTSLASIARGAYAIGKKGSAGAISHAAAVNAPTVMAASDVQAAENAGEAPSAAAVNAAAAAQADVQAAENATMDPSSAAVTDFSGQGHDVGIFAAQGDINAPGTPAAGMVGFGDFGNAPGPHGGDAGGPAPGPAGGK